MLSKWGKYTYNRHGAFLTKQTKNLFTAGSFKYEIKLYQTLPVVLQNGEKDHQSGKITHRPYWFSKFLKASNFLEQSLIQNKTNNRLN